MEERASELTCHDRALENVVQRCADKNVVHVGRLQFLYTEHGFLQTQRYNTYENQGITRTVIDMTSIDRSK